MKALIGPNAKKEPPPTACFMVNFATLNGTMISEIMDMTDPANMKGTVLKSEEKLVTMPVLRNSQVKEFLSKIGAVLQEKAAANIEGLMKEEPPELTA